MNLRALTGRPSTINPSTNNQFTGRGVGTIAAPVTAA